ncbi:uncharacterized protein [Oscarella lobularis]|uniref:uncharacterized protein isoform X2 n=1 Tax=Oscarella lobularis TaxID=121494 RepID=UPI00331405CD
MRLHEDTELDQLLNCWTRVVRGVSYPRQRLPGKDEQRKCLKLNRWCTQKRYWRLNKYHTYGYGCSNTVSYTSYYSRKRKHKTTTCTGWFLGRRCTDGYRSTYEAKSRTHVVINCRQCNIDCRVNSWGSWGACTGTCYDTTRQWKYRSVWRRSSGNGASCPSTSDWKRCYIDSKACKIGGVCYAHLRRQSSMGNGGCRECNKYASRSGWTDISGGPCNDAQACTKDDQCKDGVCSGTSFTCKSCETCNGARCTLNSGYCLIKENCYAHLQRQSLTGDGGCQECNQLVSRSAWTAVSGGPCDDAQACTKDDQCKDGVCIGTSFTCESCETCNGAGCTLNSGYCLIDGQCFSRDTKNPEIQYSQCQACKPDQSTIQWTPLTGDSCNDNDLCTHSDKCTSIGLCVGTQIPGQCSLACQECDGTSTCKITKGCVTSSNTCGCLVGGVCYDNNAVNPNNQCQYCDFGASGSSWTNYAKGTKCDDGQPCTRNDHCDAATCVSEDFTHEPECSAHLDVTNPCLRETYCDGSNCLPIYYPTSRQCYANVDECDYPDLNCEGGKAACRYCTNGSCVAVNPTNTPKGTTGVDLSTAQIFVYKSGTQIPLSLTLAPDGVNYLMITDNKAIRIKFQNFKVPCDKVTIDWRLVAKVGETNVFPQQTVTTTSAGTIDVTVTNQFTLTNGAKYKIKATAKNVRNTSSTLDTSLILVDITSPVIGAIYDGDRLPPNQQKDITYQMSNTRISAHWDPNTVYDNESGLKVTNTYQIAVGTSALSTNTNDYVTVMANSGEIKLSLQHNTIYYVTLRVYNRAGLVSTRSSNGVKVDTTNPVTGTLTIVKGTSNHTQLDYVTSPSRQIVARLKGCNDPESGIIEIRWMVCAKNVNNPLDTACNAAGNQVYSSCFDPSDCVINITLPQNNDVLYNGSFQSGYSYDLRLTIKNGALRTSSVTSNKFITDYSPPDLGTVWDSLSSDIDYQHVNTSVGVNWSGFNDDQSDLNYCQLAVYEEYNTANERVVSSFSSVPLSGSKTVTNLVGVLITGKTYTPVVRCYNKAGLFTDVPSDGVFIDAFPPIPTEILDIRFEDSFADENMDRDYQVNKTGIKTKWAAFSSVSGLESCGWSLKTDLTEVVSEMPTVSLSSTTFAHSVNLVFYTTYYASIRCTSHAGLSSTGTSDGIAPDNTHPLAGVVFDLCPDPCGLRTDIDYSPDNKMLRFRWEGFSDPHSGIDFYEWNYNQNCSGFFLLSDFKNVGVSYEVLEPLSLSHNTRYCVTVRAINGAGLKVTSISDGLLIDTTRPKRVIVKDGDIPSADRDYQSSDSVISFTWPLIQDSESYIDILEVGLGSTPGDHDTIALTMVANTTTSHTFGGLSLTQNQVYYAKVCATNAARLQTCVHSDGVLIDVTPSAKGVIIHGAMQPGNVFQADNKNIEAHWYGFKDVESAVDYFEWAIGTMANGTDIMNFAKVGSNVTFSANVRLKNGQKYFVSVICYNRAGLQITSASNGVTVDVTEPVAPLPESVVVEIAVGKALNASWPSFTDAESSIWYCQWAIGTKKCGTQVQPYTKLSNNTLRRASYKVNYVPGLRYYVSVVARNRAGLSSKVCSEGVLYDDSPPVVGVVRDGDGLNDIDYQTSTSSLSANWDIFTDDHSGIEACYVGMGTSKSTGDFYSFTLVSVGATKHVFSSITMTSGTKYFVLVRCRNGVGLESTNSSNGIIIDTTPPDVGIVETLPYQSSLGVVEAWWSEFSDSESPIDSYSWSIDGQSPMSQDVQPFVDMKLNEAASASNLTLTAFKIYYVTVRAFNKAGLSSVKSSTGILIDISPPIRGYVLDGMRESDIDWHYTDTGIGAQWHNFSDSESGVHFYRWSVGSNEEGCQILLATNVMQNTSAYCWSCFFIPGVKYFVTVEASNGVGLKTTASSDGFIVDLTEPKPGTISGLTWISNNLLQVNWTGACDHDSGPPRCWLIIVAPGQWTIKMKFHDLNEQTIHVNTSGYSYSRLVSVYVNCTDRASLTATSPSGSIDGTPPTSGSVSLLDYDKSSFTVKWGGFQDPESFVSSVELQISTNSSTETVVLSPYKGPFYKHQGNSESLYGTKQTVAARAFSSAGLVSSWVEETFDMVAPTGALDPSDCCDISMEYTDSAIYVSWSWRDGHNNESSDLGYEYCYSIGTVLGGTQILNYTNVGTARKAVCTSCLLLQGADYYVSLHVSLDNFNTYSDHQSSSFLVDLTPPVAGEVLDGLNVDNHYYKINKIFSATWKGFTDPDSPIETCEISIIDFSSNIAGRGEIWSESVRSNGTGTITRKVLTWVHDHFYQTKVSCQSELNLMVEGLSDGFLVDETPPSGGSVSFSIDSVWGELANVSGSWSDFNDDESGVASYEWLILETGERPNETMNAVGTATSFSASVNLTATTKYELVVNATNHAGLYSLRRSLGVVHDVTAPNRSYVHDGAGATDIDYQFSTTGLSSSWGRMTDDETEIVDCVWFVGTEPGTAELLSPQSIGSQTKGTCQHCVLTPGMKYYSSVMCYNSAGLRTVVSSDGIVIDSTEPVVGQVYDGKGKQDKAFQMELSFSDCSWDEFSDAESGIFEYRPCLGTGSTLLCNTHAKGKTSSTEWHFSGLSLVHNGIYYCSVTGVNAAGLSYTAVSDGVTVDSTKPKAGTVVDGTSDDVDCQHSDDAVVATWFNFYDSESGIVDYQWSIGTSIGGTDIQGFVSVGLYLTASYSNPNVTLPVGKMIFATVHAYNEAGKYSSASSDGVLVFDPQVDLAASCVSLFDL